MSEQNISVHQDENGNTLTVSTKANRIYRTTKDKEGHILSRNDVTPQFVVPGMIPSPWSKEEINDASIKLAAEALGMSEIDAKNQLNRDLVELTLRPPTVVVVQPVRLRLAGAALRRLKLSAKLVLTCTKLVFVSIRDVARALVLGR